MFQTTNHLCTFFAASICGLFQQQNHVDHPQAHAIHLDDKKIDEMTAFPLEINDNMMSW